MIITIMLSALGLVLIFALLAIVGWVSLVSGYKENAALTELVAAFHSDLVNYANSNGKDQQAFKSLSMNTTAVEQALGCDNIVSGVNIGTYMLNGVPLLPLALHEMRREYNSGYSFQQGGTIADVIQTVLFRHAGRRQELAKGIKKRMGSVGACIATGWTAVAALPLSALAAFGLLSYGRVDAARGSIPFKLWRLLLALAALSAPVLAYLADREKIDAGVRALLPWF